VLGVHVYPHVLAIELEAHHARPRAGQAHAAQDVPTQCGPQDGGVVLVGVDVELLEVGEFLPRDEGIQVNLEALLGCEERGIAAQPHCDGVDDRIQYGRLVMKYGGKGVVRRVPHIAEQHGLRAVRIHGDGHGRYLILQVERTERRDVGLGSRQQRKAQQKGQQDLKPVRQGAQVHAANLRGGHPDSFAIMS